MCIYGIAKIGLYSYNKELYTYSHLVFFLILPKCAKTREPKDEHCVSWCTYTYIHMQHPTPGQPQDSFTPSTAIHNIITFIKLD